MFCLKSVPNSRQAALTALTLHVIVTTLTSPGGCRTCEATLAPSFDETFVIKTSTANIGYHILKHLVAKNRKMIGGKVFTYALLAAVAVCALCKTEDTVQYTPWCRCRVAAQYTVLLPRPIPSSRGQKYMGTKLYITLLLILLAGDVETNPGPSTTCSLCGTQHLKAGCYDRDL